MALYGYDISKWQKVGTGDSAKNFVICKATEGAAYVDPNCDKHYQRAKSQGKLLGVYHFARPDLNGAITEADYFVKNIKGYIGEAILALDWEKNTWNVAWAKQFLDRVYELTGVRPLIYMSASVITANNWSSVASDYGLWIAGYPNKYNVKNPPTPTTKDMPYKIGAWKFWCIWQYSSSAGTLDLDIAALTEAQWRKYAEAPKKAEESAPAPAPTPQEAPQAKEEEKMVEEPKKDETPLETPEKGGNEDATDVPEVPASTDKGLSQKEYLKYAEKAEKAAKMAEKDGVKIQLSNKAYDVLKIVVAIVLPTISALYLGLANIWGLGFSEQIDATIQLIIAILNALLGVCIVKSSADYKKSNS